MVPAVHSGLSLHVNSGPARSLPATERMAHSLQRIYGLRQPGRASQGWVRFRKDADALMNNNEKPIANPFVLLREEFDDWAVLFDPDTSHGFGLNPTGVCLWKLMDGEHTVDAILEKLRAHGDNISANASDDITAFVYALVTEGLAALDSSEWGLEQRSRHAPARPSEVQPFTYEPPRLINLNSDQEAYGATCSNGSHANPCCASTGSLATSACYTGGSRSPAADCCAGTCGTPPACCGGGCPAHLACCNSGCDADCFFRFPVCYSGADGQGCVCGCAR
jgi:SynChlorMet cassette protein ScmD